MEQFIVSARKYRPSIFEDVVGQRHVTDTLLNEINSNHLAQAFLFTGPRGVGKTTCARILAKVINQKDGENYDHDFAFNIFELDAASNNSVEDIRALNEQVRIPPQVGQYKVYIIDEVHMLSAAAFNAFLKTLEEPPKYAIFILATTERHKILPTILSRCQIFNFKRIQIRDMVEHLQTICERENVTAENEALHLIAEKADGGLRDCLSIFDQMVSYCGGNITYDKAVENLNVLDRDFYFKVTDAILSQNISQVLLYFDQVLDKGFDGQLFLNGLSEHFRNLMVCRDKQTIQLLEVGEHHKATYETQGKQTELSFLLNALNINNQFDVEYKSSRNQRLHVELALIKLCHIKSLLNVTATLDEIKKKSFEVEQEELKARSDTKAKTGTAAEAKPAALASSDFSIPRITVKKTAPLPPEVQIQMAEIAEKPEAEAEDDAETLEMAESIVSEAPAILLTPASLTEAMTDFADRQKVSMKTLLKTLNLSYTDLQLRLVLGSKSQLDMIEPARVDLLAFFRSYFSNNQLQLEIVIDETREVASSQPYSAREKLGAMVADNPDLMYLIEKLNLKVK